MLIQSLTVCWQHLTILFSNLVNRAEFECAGTNDLCWFRVNLLDRQLLCIQTSIFAWSYTFSTNIISCQYKNKPVFWLPSFSVWWIGDGEGYVHWVGRDYILGWGGITTWVGEGFFFWGLGGTLTFFVFCVRLPCVLWLVFFFCNLTFYTLTFFYFIFTQLCFDFVYFDLAYFGLRIFFHFSCCLYIDLQFVFCFEQ